MSSTSAVNGVALDTDELYLKNGDVAHGISEMLTDGVIKKINDNDLRNDGTDIGQHHEPISPHITASPSVDNEDESGLNAEVGNYVNDFGSDSNHYSDLSYSVSDKQQPNIQSEHEDAHNERFLDQSSDVDGDVSMDINCSEMQNVAADGGGNSDSEHAVMNDPSSPQKSASCAASETESANSDSRNSDAKDFLTCKHGENDDTDADKPHAAADAELQLECDDDEVKTVSGNTESASQVTSASVELTCETSVEYSINSSLPSTSHVSTAGLVTSSAASLCTIPTLVISTSSLSSSSASGLLSKVAVLSATSSTAVTRPMRQTSKPVTVSVPSAANGSSGATTRQMSKVLQDVGLLLVSERVFKNLAVIQEQKLADHQRQCDSDLLQKLKTSHQNLVAKNHGLLMPSTKCWCGFQTESANVIEAHRLSCDFSRRCCYCQAGSVYRSQKLMKQHLWKVHRKIGNIDYRLGGNYMCSFCPLDFAAYLTLINHMDACRRKFWLSANLAPKEHDKDIPVTTAAKQPVKIPCWASSARISPATVSWNSSASTSVSSATVLSPAVVPPRVNLQLAAAAARNPAPVPRFIQIGKQVYPLLPSTTVAAPMIAVNRSSVSIGRVARNSAVQTTSNAKPSLPTVVNSRSTNPLAASRPITVPTPVLQCSSQFAVCSVCGAFVKDKTALLVHMHIAHSATHKLCQYCCSPDIAFPSVIELHRHIAKFHTSDCWICKASFQPADRLINHIADRHKVTMSKMLELRRCYLCSSVPLLSSYSAFEEHMIKLHPLQFADISKLWDHIIWSPNAERNWYAKQNADGTLECPLCFGQFISNSFIYRHFHLEHNGSVIRWVNCPQCAKRLPANILQVHLISAHTRKCSVHLTQIDMPDHGCIFLPPVGTKRLKNRRGEPVSSSHPRPLKRVKTAETVLISDTDDDDDGNDNEDEEDDSCDDNNDKDFVVNSRVKLQPTPLQLRSARSRVDRRNSSTDDVHEVLESIVDSGESETIAWRSVGYVSTSTSIHSAPVGTAAATQLGSGITEDEVEIIDSIVPRVCERPVQPTNRPKHSEPASGVNGGGDVALAEYNGDCQRPSTELQSASVTSSAEHLMERNQIMSNSVEEVMEVDGETLLIVHDDDSDDDDDDDDDDESD